MKKAIVTGGTGFIGYHLINELLQNNVEIYAICSPDSKNITRISGKNGVHIVYCDMNDILNLPEIIDSKGFDVFYHLAWRGASGTLRSDCIIQTNNICQTAKAAKIASELDCKKFVATGTICENQCDAINQKSEFINSSLYLNAKRSAYNIVCNVCKQYNIPLSWCTFYHPVGKYNKPEQFIINTIMKMQNGDVLNFGKAQGLFDVVAVEDLCHGLFLAGEYTLSKDRCFIGSGAPRRLMDYIEEIRLITSSHSKINYGIYQDYELPMKEEWLDISSFQNDTGYVPTRSFKSIVINAEKYLKAQKTDNS